MCINVYYQQVHFHSVVFVLPGVISLFTLLSPAGGWTVDTGQMTAHAYFILSCPLSRTKLPMVHQLMNVILWSAAGQARPDRAATRRLCPHRPAPARLSQTAGGTPAPPPHPTLSWGGGGPAPPYTPCPDTQLYCTSLFAQLDDHCQQSGSHGPAHCTDWAVNWVLCFQQI